MWYGFVLNIRPSAWCLAVSVWWPPPVVSQSAIWEAKTRTDEIKKLERKTLEENKTSPTKKHPKKLMCRPRSPCRVLLKPK